MLELVSTVVVAHVPATTGKDPDVDPLAKGFTGGVLRSAAITVNWSKQFAPYVVPEWQS
jgi:hypothetical protein